MKARRATTSDLVAVVEVLSSSHDDYVWERWAMPDDALRPAAIRKLMGVAVEFVGMVTGEVWLTDDEKSAVVWLPPSCPPPSPHGQEALAAASADAFGEGQEAIADVTAVLAAHHRDEPHWLLATMGTMPGCQRRGLGSVVIQPILDRLDDSGDAAALETSSADNVRFYERHGFVVDHLATHLPYGAPPTWIMWREPA